MCEISCGNLCSNLCVIKECVVIRVGICVLLRVVICVLINAAICVGIRKVFLAVICVVVHEVNLYGNKYGNTCAISCGNSCRSDLEVPPPLFWGWGFQICWNFSILN